MDCGEFMDTTAVDDRKNDLRDLRTRYVAAAKKALSALRLGGISNPDFRAAEQERMAIAAQINALLCTIARDRPNTREPTDLRDSEALSADSVPQPRRVKSRGRRCRDEPSRPLREPGLSAPSTVLTFHSRRSRA